MRWLWVVALALAGCAETTGVSAPADTLDAVDDAKLGFDAPTPDVDAAETPEVTTPDIADEDAGPVGGLGAPCEGDADCSDGFCAETPAGRLCTVLCTGSCPPGLRCEVVAASGGGFQQLCLPAFPRLCRPCTSNTDCAPPGLALGQRCVDFGEPGAFCGGDCAELECPVGFACEDRADVNGDVTPQCVSVAGQCPCTPDAIADGAMTHCYRENEDGRCEGTRACTVEGLEPCDAPSPAPESCNGNDDDCDGAVDEGLGEEACLESNVSGSCSGTRACEGGVWVCDAPEAAPEACDGTDNDCDGETDEEGTAGCSLRYEDSDGDGHGTGAPRCLCASEGSYSATLGGDCDDGDGAVFPGQTEACNGKDDDCAAGVDEPGAVGCLALRKDADGDGYGALGVEACLCAPSGAWADVPGGDCNDAAPGVHPGATEECNGKDDDCDGVVDQEGSAGCSAWLRDDDGDGFGVEGDERCLCAPAPPYAAAKSGDCDDSKAAVKPGQLEQCNGLDDNCDGAVDPPDALGCTPWLRDLDRDGYGVSGDAQCLCAPEPPYSAAIGGDCNDAVASVVPGQLESCNGLDDDCDGETDEVGAAGCSLFFADLDGDGAGDLGDSACTCGPVPPYVAPDAGDCDDTDAEVSPFATETCNGRDDDCDVAVDEVGATGCQAWFEDGDGDGWGSLALICLCAPAGDYTAKQPGDCDDDDPEVAPDRPEQCNGADDDCDGEVDEPGALGCAAWYADADGDGYGDPDVSACQCGPTAELTIKLGGDCDDDDPGRAPSLPEVCDGKDNDCDGLVDEGCGMPVEGWPTFGADLRRSGQAIHLHGPAAGKPLWSAPLGGVVVGSVAILPDKTVLAVTAGHLTRVSAAGDVQWQLPLPAPAVGQAGPTVRLGGTAIVGATDTVLHVAPDGTQLWATQVLGAPTEAAPVVDPDGGIYVLAHSAVTRLDTAGAVVWSSELPAGVTSKGHPAISPTGAIVHATASGGLRALDPETGELQWAHASGAPSGTGALALGATGIVYYGTSKGVTAATLTGGDFGAWAVSPAPGGLGVFNTAYKCCVPSDQVMVSTPQTTGLFKRSANLSTTVYQKAPGSAWPSATDYDGDTWVVSPTGTLVALDVAGAQKWTYKPAGATITTPPAVGAGVVVVGDSAGVLHGVGD